MDATTKSGTPSLVEAMAYLKSVKGEMYDLWFECRRIRAIAWAGSTLATDNPDCTIDHPEFECRLGHLMESIEAIADSLGNKIDEVGTRVNAAVEKLPQFQPPR